ncbi:MAG: pyridoxamine 5-phosphate oxidase [Flexibacter sp. CG_4_10_14_3_um_filter_32_15]|nr:MAG: pyridoxamine 5-phosphate oxidase [Flavobacteriaceae bacterium CG17_big_fil_post_rev_8_21_14_2_50_33_15]PIY08931.1 MAG: pyridoxamine 5-phosphate oxidase [Flexibacter sp. CG_4_10_14_3_um_filter_32_15]PJB18788.1 MAG: pyridoxamine 5-phosphate oxidase [Flavobacteriaceae bacterium CG_4_9_14_3_um_filter_33_16]
MKYPLASSTWDDNELKAIQSVIDKNMYTMGDSVLKFEENFAKFVGSKHCIMVNSGSSANLLAVAALFYTKTPKLKRGDEVIVPAVSWSTTYYPLYQYGLKLKFVDIDLQTLNFDLEQLKHAVTDQTKMILAVNLLGNPNDFDVIQKIIGERDIILMEDNCESMGAEYKGKQAGTFGIVGTYSTFFSHHMSTMEGGLITTNDLEIYHILISLRAHGWTRHLPKENLISNKSDEWFEESFRFLLPGYNVRPIEMSGAIGLEQLKKLPFFLENRRANAKLFIDLFQYSHDFYIQKNLDNSSWFGFSLIIKPNSSLKRGDIIKKLTDNNIDCRPIVSGDFTKNKVLEYFEYEIFGEMKNAKYLDKNGFFVGNHQFNIQEEIKFLFKILNG